MQGRVTRPGLYAAACEYQRLRDQGGELDPFLIAVDVCLVRWLARNQKVMCAGGIVWCTYEGDADSVDTLASIYILRSKDTTHQGIVTPILVQLDAQCRPWWPAANGVYGSTLIANGQVISPDFIVGPLNSTRTAYVPRAIVEIDTRHRSYANAKAWIRGLFAIFPSLRTGVAFKFFAPQCGNCGAFGAVVLVYRRKADDPDLNCPGDPELVYGASIGTAAVPEQMLESMDADDRAIFAANAFHDAIAVEIANGQREWASDTQRPVIRLRVEDLFYADANSLLAGAPSRLGGAHDIVDIKFRD
ncbi:hypothetical protein ACHHYP_08124 [Achlya hypogyna]|uniref:Uncharacterized protein n=1 Tax=Achlya hypogyna TaxID=1202772 RepID=A0A1V9YPN8_ACHHY|nr:hypothetical protein ACHHYP_08124 [Achlya hypogyna]